MDKYRVVSVSASGQDISGMLSRFDMNVNTKIAELEAMGYEICGPVQIALTMWNMNTYYQSGTITYEIESGDDKDDK